MSWTDDVIGFWFGALKPRQWWAVDPEVDERIRSRFGALRERLACDPPALADLDARGHLATVILFDQFSRNLFRGSAEAYATDAVALAVAVDAIDRKLDRALPDVERQFLYMPLQHSEDPAVQARSLVQFSTFADPRAMQSARRHHDTIERFGRFPHRNAALGRTSTAAELAFLAERRTPR